MVEPHPILRAFQSSGSPLVMNDPLAVSLGGAILELDPEAGRAVLGFGIELQDRSPERDCQGVVHDQRRA